MVEDQCSSDMKSLYIIKLLLQTYLLDLLEGWHFRHVYCEYSPTKSGNVRRRVGLVRIPQLLCTRNYDMRG